MDEFEFSKANYHFRFFPDTRHFPKLRQLANWQLAHCNRHFNCNHQGPKTDFWWGFWGTIHFCTTHKTIVLINHLMFFNIHIFFNFGMTYVFLVIHSLNPFWWILSLGLDHCNESVCCNVQIANSPILFIWKMSTNLVRHSNSKIYFLKVCTNVVPVNLMIIELRESLLLAKPHSLLS